MLKKVLIVALVSLFGIGLFYRIMLAWYGFSITSWWRLPGHNTDVGGKTFSLHQIGWAFDVVPDNGTQLDMLYDLPIGFKKVVPEGTHIHCQIL